jgi:hypothetical protein
MSNYFDILSSIQTTITNLNLSGLSQISIRKLPAAQESLDVLPLVIITPKDEGEKIDRAGMEDNIFVTYPVDVIIISQNNRDVTSNNLASYMDWRRQIRDSYQEPPIPNATAYLQQYSIKIKCMPDAILSRELLNLSYDYQALSIYFTVVESANNQ